jgi:hypothetical protein
MTVLAEQDGEAVYVRQDLRPVRAVSSSPYHPQPVYCKTSAPGLF